MKHLDKVKRMEIEILINKGYKQYEIANVLGVHKSTISREIKKRKMLNGKYCAYSAQHKAYVKRKYSKFQGMKIQKDKNLRNQIIKALKEYQSPEAISGRFGNISHVSVYKWLYSVWGQKYCKFLCSKRTNKKIRRKKKTRREMINSAISIHDRPVNGIHWEGDLFVSPSKMKHSVSVVTLVEKKSKYIIARKMTNRKPSTMVKNVRKCISKIKLSDITWDRGIENRYHSKFGTTNYFCDPHSPWQKPNVENNIGLLRKWFVPKKTDLSCMKQIDLDRYISILNNKWRKSLDYKSSYEKALEDGILLDEELRLGV